MFRSAAQSLATDAVFVGIGVISGFVVPFSLGMRLPERWPVPRHGRG